MMPFAMIEPTITWTTVLVALLNMMVGGLFVAIVKSRPAREKVAADREGAREKVAADREANLLSERADEMKDMRERIDKLESAAEQKDRRHEAERAIDRHRINNLSQCLDALLMLIEQDPQKAAEAAATIRAMRSEQLEREAAEKAALQSARLKAPR